MDVVVCGINGFKYSYGGSRAGYSNSQTVANLQKLAHVLQEQSWVRGMKVWIVRVVRRSPYLIGRLFRCFAASAFGRLIRRFCLVRCFVACEWSVVSPLVDELLRRL